MNWKVRIVLFTILLTSIFPYSGSSQRLIPVLEGWAGNTVNAVVFRKNSIVTHQKIQYIAFYDQDGKVVLGKRKLNSKKWELNTTQYNGNVKDAHNSISIMVDGDGYLHVSWDHHVQPLNYVKSLSPNSLFLTDKMPMTSLLETNVTYPEFYMLPNGDLLFMYRDGHSGQGNLVINRYDLRTKHWSQLHGNLIDGEHSRNAYWQAYVDHLGVIHLSWVWRSSGDVATNHDMAYARSVDGGITWQKTSGELYELPIRAANAEYAWRIPQKSELINSTSMAADEDGNPYIANYWRDIDSSVPQYRVIRFSGKGWQSYNLNFRSLGFSLRGGGTKSIPISRPQILVKGKAEKTQVYLLFRDAQRGSKVSMASSTDLLNNVWKIRDLSSMNVGNWEPSFDTELWKTTKKLHVFVQNVAQIDGEGIAKVKPEMVYVMEAIK
ncbi:MAG: neuraminidase [Paludibacter sp.]|nr:neuraminidase [Paludibacter sp.]